MAIFALLLVNSDKAVLLSCEAQVDTTLCAPHSDNTSAAWVFAPALFWHDDRPVISVVPTYSCWWHLCSGTSVPLPGELSLNMLGQSSLLLQDFLLHAKAAFNLTFELE